MPAGIAELTLLAALGWWPGGAGATLRPLLFGGAFAVYAFTAYRILRTEGGHAQVWLFAVLMRLALFPLAPELSGDLYRYLWHGHVQLSGLNPYRFAPDAPELVELRRGYHALIEDPSARAAHGPVAQLVFLALAAVGGALYQAKLLWLGLDLMTGWLLSKVAHITGRSRRLTLVLYLWSPLLLVEVAWNGHLEPLGLFTLVLIVLLARAPVSAGLAAAASGLAGFLPLAAAPPLTRRLGARFAAGFVLAAIVIYLPYLTAGLSAFTGPWSHLWSASFLGGPFVLLEAALPGSLLPRLAALTGLGAVVAWATAARLRPERALFWVLGSALVLTPVLRPWYVLWILPLAALRVSVQWIVLSGLVILGYHGLETFQETGVQTEPFWLRPLVWLPFLALLARDAVRVWRERVPPAPLSDPA